MVATLSSLITDGTLSPVGYNETDDLYVFIFDNTEGNSESSVKFTLEEIWTRPIAIGLPPLFLTGLIGFFIFIAGLATMAITRLRKKLQK